MPQKPATNIHPRSDATLPRDSQPTPTVLLARAVILALLPQPMKEHHMFSIRSKLVTAAAVGAAAVSGAAIAGAATSGNSSSTTAAPAASSSAPSAPQHDPSKGGHTVNGKTEKLLTGDVESKVRAAALAKVPGTVERVETNVDSSAPYEAHIKKADGTEVEVQVNSDYSVAAVNAMGQHP
jgi:hypothetical protein